MERIDYIEDFILPDIQKYRCLEDNVFECYQTSDFRTKGIVGYTVHKNQIIMKNSTLYREEKGLFGKVTRTPYNGKVFSCIKDIYVYYRVQDDGSVSRVATNKLILCEQEEK